MNLDQLKLLRSAARVSRMHIFTTHHQQSVGEHTFGVLSLLFFVIPEPTMAMVRGCLYHDAAEAMTGDVPAPTKWRYPALGEALAAAEQDIERSHGIEVSMTEHEKRVLAYCDLMELALYASEEVDIGNHGAASVLRNCLIALRHKNLPSVSPAARELYEFIVSRTNAHYKLDLGELRLCGWAG